MQAEKCAPVIQSLLKFVWWLEAFKNLQEERWWSLFSKSRKIQTVCFNREEVMSPIIKCFIPDWTQHSCSWDPGRGCPCVPWPGVCWCRVEAWSLAYLSRSPSGTVWWGLSGVWTAAGTALCPRGRNRAGKKVLFGSLLWKFACSRNKVTQWQSTI